MYDLYDVYKYLQKYTLVKTQYAPLVSLSLTYWINGLYDDWIIGDNATTRWEVIQELTGKGFI